MITKRDKEVLIWIEKYGAITINQAKILFFNGNYDNARRRLRVLEEQEVLNSYILKETKEKVYFTEGKKKSYHDILILNYAVKLKELGCRLVVINIKPRYLKGSLVPDAFVSFAYNNDLYITLLEVDYKHYTEYLKFTSLYERLYRSKEDYLEFQGTFPIVVVANMNKSIRYNSQNFNMMWTDLAYSNLQELLL